MVPYSGSANVTWFAATGSAAVVDGKLAPREYAEAALAQIEDEKDTLVLASVLASLAQASLGSPSILKYLPDSERVAYRARMEAAFLRGLERAPAGSDLQLEWYFALLEVARSPRARGLLADLLDGRREIAGLRVETAGRAAEAICTEIMGLFEPPLERR